MAFYGIPTLNRSIARWTGVAMLVAFAGCSDSPEQADADVADSAVADASPSDAATPIDAAAPGDATTPVDAFVPPSTGCTVVDSGWTEVPLPEGARSIYVSASGDDGNDGTSTSAPVATLSRGIALLREGSADQLLLRRGDTFENQQLGNWAHNGLSESARVLVGAYGPADEPRPIIVPPEGGGILFTNGGGGLGDRPLEHVVFQSLHFYAAWHDPAHPSFAGHDRLSKAVELLRPVRNVVFEDVRIERFSTGIVIQPPRDTGSGNIVLRRNLIVDSYAIHDDTHSQGIFLSGNLNGGNVLIEENVFDHNGWLETPAGPAGRATQFNHNAYIIAPDVTLRDNIIARGSSNGFQMRSNGVAENNLLIGNAIAGFVAANEVSPGRRQVLRHNVALHPSLRILDDDRSRGWGLELQGNANAADFEEIAAIGNILAYGDAPATTPLDLDDIAGAPGYEARDNRVWSWGDRPDQGAAPSDARDLASYQQSIGDAGGIEAFLQRARQQQRGRYCREYTADAVNSYVREGFGIAR